MAGITFEQVVGAIEALTIHGERVTAANIRAELGRGSMSTILRHLQAWRSEQGKTKPKPDTQDRDYSALHKVVNDLIREATVQVEHEAGRAARENAEIIKGLMAEADEAKERLQELEERVARLTEEGGKLQAQKAGLETELAAAKEELRELRQRNERLIEDRATAKAEAETLRQLVPSQGDMEPKAAETEPDPTPEPEPEIKTAAPSKPRAKRQGIITEQVTALLFEQKPAEEPPEDAKEE